MKIYSLKTIMNRTLDDVTYLRDYGTITEELWDAYYYLWFWGCFRYGEHPCPDNIEAIQGHLSPDNLLVFQEYMDRLFIAGRV